MTFQSGVCANPNGRPKGSRNKQGRLFQEACDEADKRGYPHPYLQMAEWANDPNMPLEVRVILLKECAAYRCTKPKQTVAIEPKAPDLSSPETAEDSLAALITEMSQELEPAELVNLIGAWIDSKRKSKELELKVASQGSSGVQRIEIVGGLPSLPMRPTEGSVIMPSNDSINGHEFNGQTIDAIAAPGPETKPTEP